MKPSPIRDLARRYAAGELSLDEYRAQRRKMIDGITSGALNLEYGESALSHRKQVRSLWISAIIPAVLATGVGTFAWVEHSRQIKEHDAQSRAVQEGGPALVRSFMDTNDWGDANIGMFLQRWDALPAYEKKAARLSYLFPRLQSQLQEQIVSQQAVVDLAAGDNADSNTASMHLAHLQHLAAALGVKQED